MRHSELCSSIYYSGGILLVFQQILGQPTNTAPHTHSIDSVSSAIIWICLFMLYVEIWALFALNRRDTMEHCGISRSGCWVCTNSLLVFLRRRLLRQRRQLRKISATSLSDLIQLNSSVSVMECTSCFDTSKSDFHVMVTKFSRSSVPTTSPPLKWLFTTKWPTNVVWMSAIEKAKMSNGKERRKRNSASHLLEQIIFHKTHKSQD